MDEGKSKKSVSIRRQKKAHKSDVRKPGKRKRKANTLSGEDIEHTAKIVKSGRKELNVTTERVDDIPLLITAMVKMGIQGAIDKYIPVKKHQRDLSWGWTAVIWLAYILL